MVRIGDSPFAPIFEVVEKPNTWERDLEKPVNEAEAKRTKLREEFWNAYLNRHPDIADEKRGLLLQHLERYSAPEKGTVG